ncbi:MAG: LytTR family DNA-binding domain-containing protein [Lachnospiraceae bacterium]|nr:LytTR family DNA-binding domain-containing protein [Lachnospiraceae bacterium]
MRIAICDDSKIDAKRINWALMDLSNDLETDYYPSGHDLIDALKNGEKFDAVFLDVYMPGEFGVDVAEQLKAISPRTDIIFCTSSKEHAVDAFKVEAIDYLVKPFEEIDVVKALARVNLAAEMRSNSPIMLKSGSEILIFPPESVLRIESDKHYTIITKADGDSERVHMGFSAVYDLFRDRFMLIKRGLSVCMDHVEKIVGDVVYMNDGSSYIMSRANKDQIINQFLGYMENKKYNK